MMGIFALQPCQIYFLHLPVDYQFLMVLVITVTVNTEKREIALCETKAANEFYQLYLIHS